jgi:hypothetical protein
MENDVKKKDYGKVALSLFFLCILLLLIIIFLSFDRGVFVSDVSPVCDFNDSFNSGLSQGYSLGMNDSVRSLLFYSQNCSIATINLSNGMFGFIDVTCLNNKDAMTKILGGD